MQLFAHRGMKPVAPDDDVGALRGQGLAGGRALEVCDNLRCECFDRHAFGAADDRIGADARANGIEQHVLQLAAMDGILRLLVPRVAAERLAVDELAETIEEDRFGRQYRRPRQCAIHPELGECLRGVGKDIDPHAERAHLGHGLVDAA